MSLLKTYLFPLLKRYIGFAVAMILVSALATSLLYAGVSSYNTFSNSYDDYFEKYGYPDAVIRTDYALKDDFLKLKDVSGIEAEEARQTFYCNLQTSTANVSVKLSEYHESGIVSLYDVESVQPMTSLPNIALERTFASNNGIKPGDTVYIEFDSVFYKFYVEKTVQSCETVYFYINDYLLADQRYLGCAYIPSAELKKFFVLTNRPEMILLANEVMLSVHPNADSEFVLEECKKITSGFTDIADTTQKEDAAGIVRMNNYLGSIEKISKYIPAVFYIVMIVVVLLFMIQIIKSSSKSIAVLMMLGHHKKNIITLYSVFSLFISFASVIISIFTGSIVKNLLLDIYMNNHFIPYLIDYNDTKIMLLAALFTVIAGQLACSISLLEMKNISPQKIMNREFGISELLGQKRTAKKALRAEAISKLPVRLQMAYSGIVRNPGRLFVSAFAFFSAVVLIFLSLSINVSTEKVLNQYCNKRLVADAQFVMFDYIEDDTMHEKLESQEYVSGVETVLISQVTLSANGHSKSFQISGVDLDSRYFVIPDRNDSSFLSVPEIGVIIDSQFAKEAGIVQGDTVYLNGTPVSVTDIASFYANKTLVVSKEQFYSLGLDGYKTYLLDLTDNEAFAEWLVKNDINGYTMFSDNLAAELKDLNSAYKSLTTLMIIFAVCIGFTVICIMSISGYLEQKRMMSVMRVLGYKMRSVSFVWFLQYFLFFIIGTVLAIPVMRLLTERFLELISKNATTYPFVDTPEMYILPIAAVFVMYIAVHIVTMIFARTQNIPENIKSRE